MPWGWLLGIAALGAALRLWELGAKPPWIDELFTFVAVRRPWGEILTEPGSPMTPPLYYAIVALFERISDSVLAMRLPSVFFGSALVVVTGYAGVRFGGHRVGILAALLVAVSPFQVRVSQEARMYSLVPLLAILILLLCQRVIEKRRQHEALVLGFLLAALVAVHYVGLVMVVAVAARFLMEGRRLKECWRSGVVAVCSALLLIAPLVPMMLAARGYSIALEMPVGSVQWRPSMLWVHFVGYMRALDELPQSQVIFALLGVVVLMVVVASLRPLLREKSSIGKTILALSLLPTILAFIYLSMTNAAQITDRTFAFAYPGFVLLVAYSMIRVLRLRAQRALVAAFVGLNIVTLVALYRTPEAFSRGWVTVLSQIEDEGGEFLVLPEDYGRMYAAWLDRDTLIPLPTELVLDGDPAESFPNGVFLVTLHSEKGPARIFGKDRRVLGRLDRAFPKRSSQRAGDLKIERFLPARPEKAEMAATEPGE